MLEGIEEIVHPGFENCHWVLQVELFKDFWVQDTDASDNFLVEDDVCTSLWEVHRVLRLLQEVVLAESSANLGHQLI